MAPTPITIITGFLGSGKTTVILNLVPQLPSTYRLALLKNEFGDVAIDSQIAASHAIAGVRELLDGCICCNLVGQLGDALETLRRDVDPDRIIIETSGSAFPATLAMEVNRLARDTDGEKYVLDGVVVVIDVENWKGYEDTSYTAKLQAKYTDLVILNKWEDAGERRLDDCIDRLGDLDVDVPFVKTDRGLVSKDALLGFDRSLAGHLGMTDADGLNGIQGGDGGGHHHGEDVQEEHTREVDVLSITLSTSRKDAVIDIGKLEELLRTASKEEVYRIKAILSTDHVPSSNNSIHHQQQNDEVQDIVPVMCILNWAFGRWTFFTTPNSQISSQAGQPPSSTAEAAAAATTTTTTTTTTASASPSQPDTTTIETPILRMTVVLARNEGNKWRNRIQQNEWIQTKGQDDTAILTVDIK